MKTQWIRAVRRSIPTMILSLGPGMLCGACSDEPEFDFTHQAGERCEGCESCEDSIVSPCQCETCIDTAYDPEKLQLLVCVGGRWQLDEECPGGVSVECGDKGGYHMTCLDENGEEVE